MAATPAFFVKVKAGLATFSNAADVEIIPAAPEGGLRIDNLFVCATATVSANTKIVVKISPDGGTNKRNVEEIAYGAYTAAAGAAAPTVQSAVLPGMVLPAGYSVYVIGAAADTFHAVAPYAVA